MSFLRSHFCSFSCRRSCLNFRRNKPRKRFNVLGALSAITHELVMVTNVTSVTAESVCVLSRRIAEHRTTLSAYSLKLSLIEMPRKFVKKKVIYSKHYAYLSEFRTAITDCRYQSQTTCKNERGSLIMLNIQEFKKYEFVPMRGINASFK